MSGGIGLGISNHGTAFNFGTLVGGKANGGMGASVGYKCVLTNEAGGVIDGYDGVVAGGYAQVTNFGTMIGVSGGAVVMSKSTARLNAEAGSVFEGVAIMGGALFDAVGGTTSLTGFATSGQVEGAGTIALDSGHSYFDAGSSLTAAAVRIAGAATEVFVDTKLAFARTWDQTAGTLYVTSGDQITFTGAGDTFTGLVTGHGAVLFTGGSDTFSNVSLSATKMVVNGPAITLNGTVNLTTTMTVTSTAVSVATAGAALQGGGSLNLSNTAANAIKGATASAQLSVTDGKVTGAGTISGLVLAVGAKGVINANQSNGLTINTGASTIVNAGLIENVGAGGMTIAGAVNNTGTLLVSNGFLNVEGAVSGAGTVRILGGTVKFGSTFTENVAFGAAGRLELAHATTYAGKVSGFSKTGATSFDLDDIAFGSTTVAYSGTTASGVLTVSDGTHTAKITLIGDYTASSWVTTSDGHGGTSIHDPTAPLASAMAGFGAGSDGSSPPSVDGSGRVAHLLAHASRA
jgi:hypothetical protein